MAFAVNRLARALLAIASTALLFGFGNGLNPWWPLVWFAPVPILVLALYSSWRVTLLAAFASFLAGCLNMWAYFRALEAPLYAWAMVFSTAALVFALAVLLFRALMRRGSPWTSLVAFPAMWVSFEYLRNGTTPHGTAGSLAYSQLHFLPFLQLASLTGPWGMTFVLFLFPTALAIGIFFRQTDPRQAARIVVATAGLIAIVLIAGALRLAQPRPPQHVTVGLIASDQPINDTVTAEGAETARLFRNYAAEAVRLIAQGAQIVILPEKLGVVLDPDNNATDPIFQALADRNHAAIVVGEVHVSPATNQAAKSPQAVKYNQARVYLPGSPPLTYNKHHMLPPFESSLKPGVMLTLLRASSETLGVSICKDMDFTPLSRQYGQAGAGLMLVPAWDFNLDRAWHGHIAVMRGVEDGFAIARSAKNGYLTVSDDRGRILAEARSDSAPFATLLAEVPVAHSATFYLIFGDWFAWFAVAIFFIALIRLFQLDRRFRIAAHPDAIPAA
jgi:apolipoprotein N-acyltransferase